MENSLFRKKSLERISSPEQMHDYMRVTSPRLWMLLTAIVVLVSGFIVYAAMTNIESTLPIKVTVDSYEYSRENEDGTVTSKVESVGYAEIPASYKDSVSVGMPVRLGEETGKVSMIITADDQTLQVMIDLDNGNLKWPDGEIDAELILETTTPISFLWNS